MTKNALKYEDKNINSKNSNSKHTTRSMHRLRDEKIKGYLQKIEEAHSCKESEGKIIAIGIDELGNTYCGYCHQKVNYPKVSEEEIKEIKEFIKNEV